MTYLSQLRTFLEAYRTGSISKAAERLYLTQPAASAQIKSLESLMEKKLFIRHARGIKPTAIADDLARSISPHLEQIEAKFNAVRSRIASVAGTIHLASPAEFMEAKLLPVVSSLLDHDIRVRIHLGGKDRIYQLLDDGTADLAITASQPKYRALDFTAIAQETLILVAASNWAKQYLVQPFDHKQLLTLPLIAYDEDLPLIRDYFSQVFQIKTEIQAAVTVADLRMVRSLIALEQGYTVLPKYLCEPQLRSGELCQLYQSKSDPNNSLYLVWSNGHLKHPRVVYVRDRLLEMLRN